MKLRLAHKILKALGADRERAYSSLQIRRAISRGERWLRRNHPGFNSDDFDDYDDGYEREYEVVGSCDECDCDLWEDDAHFIGGEQVCGQCYFYIENA